MQLMFNFSEVLYVTSNPDFFEQVPKFNYLSFTQSIESTNHGSAVICPTNQNTQKAVILNKDVSITENFELITAQRSEKITISSDSVLNKQTLYIQSPDGLIYFTDAQLSEPLELFKLGAKCFELTIMETTEAVLLVYLKPLDFILHQG